MKDTVCRLNLTATRVPAKHYTKVSQGIMREAEKRNIRADRPYRIFRYGFFKRKVDFTITLYGGDLTVLRQFAKAIPFSRYK